MHLPAATVLVKRFVASPVVPPGIKERGRYKPMFKRRCSP